jgi:hypothetical protein
MIPAFYRSVLNETHAFCGIGKFKFSCLWFAQLKLNACIFFLSTKSCGSFDKNKILRQTFIAYSMMTINSSS